MWHSNVKFCAVCYCGHRNAVCRLVCSAVLLCDDLLTHSCYCFCCAACACNIVYKCNAALPLWDFKLCCAAIFADPACMQCSADSDLQCVVLFLWYRTSLDMFGLYICSAPFANFSETKMVVGRSTLYCIIVGLGFVSLSHVFVSVSQAFFIRHLRQRNWIFQVLDDVRRQNDLELFH